MSGRNSRSRSRTPGQSFAKQPSRKELSVLRQWSSTLDAMPEMIVITDLEGMIVRINRAVAERLGLGFKDILARHVTEIFGELPFSSISNSMPGPIEVTLPFCEGVFQLSCFPNVDPEGERIGMILVFRDITAEKRVRERLLDAEKMAMLSAVLRGVAHELNNPLAGVLGFAQLAMELSSEPAVKECLETVQAEAERVSKIVRNLIAFARRSQAKTKPLNLMDVLDKARDLVAYEMRLAHVVVESQIPENLPLVSGDAQQLQEVFVSILLFATRHSGGAGLGQVVKLRAWLQETDVVVEIETEGPHFTEEALEHLLELSGYAWSGQEVGLALAKSYVVQQGGKLTVSRTNKGRLVFTLVLPAAQREEDDEPEETGGFEVKGLRILVADDDRVSANLIAKVLESSGAQVSVVEDGRAALAELMKNTYDLVVLDVKMPGMDARQLLASLQEKGRKDAIVLVSGDIMSKDTIAFMESSGLPYVIKPFSLSALRGAVRRALGWGQATIRNVT